MGYYSTLQGEITITPPLTHRELRDADPVMVDANRSVYVRVVKTVDESPNGTLTRTTGPAVVPNEESAKFYELGEDLQALVDAFPGHDWDGYIERHGEEAGDMERLYVRGGRVVSVMPTITWPST
jgi:hypothetical protein